MPSEQDCAYAAGFFDGEGSISIAVPNVRSTARLQIGLTQGDPAPLLWVRERWGGSVYSYVPDERLTKRRVGWRWQAGPRQSLVFLQDVRPWLKVKDKEADIAITFQLARRPPGYLRHRPQAERDANAAEGRVAHARIVELRRGVGA